jgi:hypothetical protein
MKSLYYTAILNSISTLIKTENKLDNVLYSWAYKRDFRARLVDDFGHLPHFTTLFNRLWDQFTLNKFKPDFLELAMILNFKFHEGNMKIGSMCGTQPSSGPVSVIESMEHYYGRRIDGPVEMSARLLEHKIILEDIANCRTDLIFQEIDDEFLNEFKKMVGDMSPHYDLTLSDTSNVSTAITDKISMVADEILNSTGVRGNVAWISPLHLLELASDGLYAPISVGFPQGIYNHVGMLIDPLDDTKKIKVYCDFSLKDNIFVGYKTDDVDCGIVFAPYMILSYGNIVDPIRRETVIGLMSRYAWWTGKDHDRFNYYGVIDVKTPTTVEYESDSLLLKLKNMLNEYIPNHLPENTKQKITESVLKEYNTTTVDKKMGIYDLQLRAVAVIENIGVSHLLGCNDVVIQPLLGEYRELHEILGTLNNEYKRLNKFPMLKTHVPKFKLSEIKTALFKDLQQLVEKHDIECDIKLLMKQL